MVKWCSSCGGEYWARWRNEPVSLCPDCRLDVVICSSCAALVRGPHDPAQVELFADAIYVAPRRIDAPSEEERYWSLRAKATQAARRRYPYC